ncbi:hypothetical protein [Sorangium sp. So ce233]|uniref:hypothetical protein n=1 Tax=Sorangium sp. So ce233 TaxID=3133290 RepID=UPI003F5F8931
MPDAEERLTLATCAFVAGCILLAPREWVSAGLALTIAAALFVWHLRLRRGASPSGPAAQAQGAAGAPRASGEAGAQPRPGDERRESA